MKKLNSNLGNKNTISDIMASCNCRPSCGCNSGANYEGAMNYYLYLSRVRSNAGQSEPN